MSNVIQLNLPSRRQRRAVRHAALLENFARNRRYGDDVFWLKENAELLNILECTGTALEPEALESHAGFYGNVEKRMGFFPQYYRFLLSICLDLEDLGLAQGAEGKGEYLARWVADQGLVDAELSDLQRGEGRRLMQRRGVSPRTDDAGLDDRLRAFVARSQTFAMPNKKAAYELTHIVFYLSEYGRKDPLLSNGTKESLIFAGTLSYLERNADLLSEVCVAMTYAGYNPPAKWVDWLSGVTSGFKVAQGDKAVKQDDYHEYLVCNWAVATAAGGEAFVHPVVADSISFHRMDDRAAPLREMSECMFRLDDRRSSDWGLMRPYLLETLSETSRDILLEAEAACDDFDAFFAGFARTGLNAGLPLRPTGSAG